MAEAKIKTAKPPRRRSPRRRPRPSTRGWRLRSQAMTSAITRTTRRSVSDAEYDALRKRYNAIEARFPDLRTLESLSQKVGAAPSARFKGPPRGADAVARQRLCRTGRRRFRRPHPPLSQTQMTTRRSPSTPSRRSTGCRCRCATRTANSSPRPPAATAPRARTSPPMSAPSRHAEALKGQACRNLRGARRGLYDQARHFSRSMSARPRAASSSPIRAIPPPARLRQKDPSITASRPLASSPMPGAR
jgi:hypothetical protein